MNRCDKCGQELPADDDVPFGDAMRAVDPRLVVEPRDWPTVLVDPERHDPPTAWERAADWASRTWHRMIDVR